MVKISGGDHVQGLISYNKWVLNYRKIDCTTRELETLAAR